MQVFIEYLGIILDAGDVLMNKVDKILHLHEFTFHKGEKIKLNIYVYVHTYTYTCLCKYIHILYVYTYMRLDGKMPLENNEAEKNDGRSQR